MAFGSLNFLVLIYTTQNKLISTFYPSDLTGKCSFHIYYDMYFLVRKMEKSRIFLTKCVRTACSQLLTRLEQVVMYHRVTKLMRSTDPQQVVPTSLISSARNKLLTSCRQQSRSNFLRTSCISLVGTTCSKSVTVIILITR